MSTISDIIWGANDVRLYTDSSCHRMSWGKFIGDDIFLIVDKKVIYNMKISIEEQSVTIVFRQRSDAFRIIGLTMNIPLYDIDDFELDDTDLEIVIKGGSTTAKKFINKDFI